MTAQQLLEYSNEPYVQELVEGILYEMEPPGFEHGRVALTVGALLFAHVREHKLGFAVGEVGFLLASKPDTVRAPDACFVAAERVPEGGIPVGYWPGPPDLAVEVISPNDRHTAVEAKALDWLRAGTRVVVVLDPPLKTATVYRSRHDIRVLAGDEPLDLHDVVPGFAPRTGDLFA
jgi:Uma2 family endonuclease